MRNPARIDYINHILMMRKLDEAYAREAFKFYDNLMPWLDLGQGIKEALSGKE